MKKTQSGFTLIELLVVVSIIALLWSIVLVAMGGTRAQARDSRRLSDMRQIVSAITVYYDKYEAFPPITSDACCDGWDTGPCVTQPTNEFIGMLRTRNILVTPKDPGTIPAAATTASCNYGYAYYVYEAGSYGCDARRGRFFVLGIRNMETSGRPHPASPGFSCPTRSWNTEFEWVIGKFEKDF